ncbi:hypothetical protein [Methylibium rhizosphaerae]|uniref:hypothetical protein n=1 Tax=Methylibium rhizosphaerae TaxID=2570323 RepID=UPI001FED2001|nr:hypothetical protein [Methylibium rhizosphaerae]
MAAVIEGLHLRRGCHVRRDPVSTRTVLIPDPVAEFVDTFRVDWHLSIRELVRIEGSITRNVGNAQASIAQEACGGFERQGPEPLVIEATDVAVIPVEVEGRYVALFRVVCSREQQAELVGSTDDGDVFGIRRECQVAIHTSGDRIEYHTCGDTNFARRD